MSNAISRCHGGNLRYAVFVFVIVQACSTASSPRNELHHRRPIPHVVLNTVVVDSQLFPRKHLGTVYRYGSGEMQRDVYVYPKAQWPDPETQARIFIDVLEVEKRRGDFESYRVLANSSFNLDVSGHLLAGQEVTMQFRRRGQEHVSYFAVLSLPDIYAKFRISRPVTSADTIRRGFVEAWAAAYLKSQP